MILLYELQEHFSRVFDILLHLDQERNSLPAVQQSVIIGESKVHHRADFDLSVHLNGAVFDGVEAKYGSLRQVDNGSAHQGTEDTSVADGEGTASHILNGQLAIPGL